jgi:hypothetical protein
MRINKADSSEIFDAFASNMSRYQMKKQAAGPIKLAPEVAGAGTEALGAIKTLDDFHAAYRTISETGDIVKDLASAKELITAIETASKSNRALLRDPDFVGDFAENGAELLDYFDEIRGMARATNDPEVRKIMLEIDKTYAPLKGFVEYAEEASASLALRSADELGQTGSEAVQQGTKQAPEPEAPKPESPRPEPEAPKPEPEAPRTDAPDAPAGTPPAQAGSIASEATETIATDVSQVRNIPVSKGEKDAIQAVAELSEEVGALRATAEQASEAARGAAEAARQTGEQTRRELSEALTDFAEDLKEAERAKEATRATEMDELAERLTRGQADFKQQILKEVREGMDEAADTAKDATKRSRRSMTPTSVGDAVKSGSLEWLKDAFSKGSVAGTAWKTVKIGAAVGMLLLLAGGSYALYQYLNDDDELRERYLAELDGLAAAITASTTAHKALQFNNETHGQEQNAGVLEELVDNAESPRLLKDMRDESQDTFLAAARNLDELKAEVEAFHADSAAIQADLQSNNGWTEVVSADQALLQSLETFQAVFQDILQGIPSAPSQGGGLRGGPGGGGLRGGEGQSGTPSASGPIPEGQQVPLEVFGTTLDISHKPPGFRSAAPRMVRRLLSHPVGMAFVDPHNRWGGFVRKTGNPEVDYLNALGYLYREGVFTPSQMRKFIRHNLPKQGRRRHSNWKNAVKYYRRNPVSHKTAENILLYPHLYKESTNREGITMKKAADQYPNKYIADAISGLSDQYAKSYYAGLKSQYNAKDAKPKADYRELYDVHGEKGSDLIQEAHPEAIVVSDAMGNGGLVENLLEQKSHSEGVAKSAPTGNFRGKHANLAVIEALNKIANQADDDGLFEVSELIESTIQQLF